MAVALVLGGGVGGGRVSGLQTPLLGFLLVCSHSEDLLSVFSSPKVSQTPRGAGASSASSLQSNRNGSVVLTQV